MKVVNEIEKIVEALNVIKYFKELEDKQDFATKLVKISGNEFDIVKELFKMEFWLDINPKRRKKDYKKFIYNWVSRILQRKENVRKMYQFERGYRDGRTDQFKPSKKIVE
jgi:hypothetical protein